ncbi:MAG TPA: FHA domain-containing protein, partial [Polyangiaceae bacterium]
MATLIEQAGTQRVVLESECIVGRSPRCSLRIENAMISAVHACVRWTPDGWQVRDLGSRNGTFLNGARITSSDGAAVRRGDKLAFGTLDVVWELLDETPPEPMAVGEN